MTTKNFMNKKLLKNAICFLTLLILIAPVIAMAEVTTDPTYGTEDLSGIDLPQPQSDLPNIVVRIINLILGFLALIAIVIILIGGFEWMTAGGNDDKVKTAKKRLQYGLIGLVIIFVAYGVVIWVLNTLYTQLNQ